jgi:hypothetical protein
MGRLHKNPEEPGVPVWVCAVCGRPEKEKTYGCKHAEDESTYALVRETHYREAQKEMTEAHLKASANRKRG